MDLSPEDSVPKGQRPKRLLRVNRRIRRRKRLGELRERFGVHIYVLPNLLTTGNMFFGFMGIIYSIKGDFLFAAYAIVAAAVFDLLDGRVARMTNSESAFGAQYDSLSDLVSFGWRRRILYR